MLNQDHDYLNHDYAPHRLLLQEKSWDRSKPLLIIDELHKMKNWKSYLKGIYDVEGLIPPIVVTGSARLDTIKKTGDSLAGRFFQFRLHPLDLKELKGIMPAREALERISILGGFPEPFLNNNRSFYKRWRKSHLDIILRQDLIDLESVRNIQLMETLIELLKNRVGNPVSYSSLAMDLECSAKSVKNWLTILENLYLVFPVRPFHKNIGRAILKEPKYYFYDSGLVEDNPGAGLENIAACTLIKELNFLEDIYGLKCSLNYIKNKEGKEIDFFLQVEKNQYLIEIKSGGNTLSANFKVFKKCLPGARVIQLMKGLEREKTFSDGSQIRDFAGWLQNCNLKPGD